MPQGENNLSKAKRRIYNNQENVIEFDQNRKQNPRKSKIFNNDFIKNNFSLAKSH